MGIQKHGTTQTGQNVRARALGATHLHRDEGKSKSEDSAPNPCAKVAGKCLRLLESESPRLRSPGEQAGPGQERR